MIGRKTMLGLSVLGALLICAVAAQSAFAVTGKANATAFTCVASGGETNKDFKDAHCDEKTTAGTGSFEHLKIAVGTETKLAATNEKVTTNTTASEPAVLKSTVGGSKVTITCSKVKNDPTKSFVLNKTEGEAHRLTGTALTEFGAAGSKDCKVTELEKCEVKEPIISEATFEGSNGHTGPKGEANAMGLTFKGEGVEETFATIEFIGPECGVKGVIAKVKGSVIATSGPTTESKQDNLWSGATLAFTPKFEMQKLKLGVNPAEFSTIITPTMAEGGNPVAGTTCTKAPPSC